MSETKFTPELIAAVAAAFSVYVIITSCRNFVGYNPTAPSAWTRLKAWWPGFVKRNIVDGDPYNDESHAETRYAYDYIDWEKVPKGFDWVARDDDMGLIGMYTSKPELREASWSNGKDYVSVPNLAIIGPFPNWRDSLRHRPGK